MMAQWVHMSGCNGLRADWCLQCLRGYLPVPTTACKKKSIREELYRTPEKCIRGRLRYCCENRPRDAGHAEISWKWIANFKHSHQLLVYLFWNIRQQIFPHMKMEKRNIWFICIMPRLLLRLWLGTTLNAPFIRQQFNYSLTRRANQPITSWTQCMEACRRGQNNLLKFAWLIRFEWIH